MARLRGCLLGLVLGWYLGRRSGARAASRRRPGRSEFEFLSLMSHELKTPINVISGYLELLEGGIPDPLPASAREHVHQARLATQRMTDLVNNLFTWTRLRRRRERVYIERIRAQDMVRDACQSLREQAAARGLQLRMDVPADLWLRTDRSKACQALRALCSNAVKFTEAGSIRITARAHGERVRFHVQDTGVGIAPEHLPVIFEPYWQMESPVHRTRGGVGIGLTVARELAWLLGGEIVVRSVPGEGSEFILDLPGGFHERGEDGPAGG